MSAAADLDSFLNGVPTAREPGARPPSRLNYSHAGMIDLIIATPGITQDEIGKKLGYSSSWVSTVMSTDVFKVELEKRRKELIDPTVLASVKERFEGVARRALEVIESKLNKPNDLITENFALRSFEVASRAAGFGARVENPPVSPVEVHVHLEEMKGNLTRLLTSARPPLEHSPPAALSAPGADS